MKKVILISLVLVLGLAVNVWADMIPVGSSDWTGSRSTPQSFGIVGTGSWENDFNISWAITFDSTSHLYTYTYTFLDLPQNLSHWLLQVSYGIPMSMFIFPDGYNVEFDTWESGPGNPMLPASIYGIKFDFGTTEGTGTYTFQTYQNPVWGDFYAKDGTGNYAWNSGIETDPTAGASSFIPWIPTPDTEGVPFPEPSTFLLIGAGLFGLGFFGRRFKK